MPYQVIILLAALAVVLLIAWRELARRWSR